MSVGIGRRRVWRWRWTSQALECYQQTHGGKQKRPVPRVQETSTWACTSRHTAIPAHDAAKIVDT